jgi:hypothetical protein
MFIYLHIINTFWGWGSFGCWSQAAQQDHHPPEIWISHQLVHLWNSFSHSNSQVIVSLLVKMNENLLVTFTKYFKQQSGA